MTLSEICKMDARERDRLVAEKVMGWRHDYRFSQTHAESWRIVREGDETPSEIVASGNWSPSTDTAADYAVLCHVREKWDDGDKREFLTALRTIWAARPEAVKGCWNHAELPMAYLVGDYSLAALIKIKVPDCGEETE